MAIAQSNGEPEIDAKIGVFEEFVSHVVEMNSFEFTYNNDAVIF